MQRYRDVKSSTIKDRQSISLDPVIPSTPLSTSRLVYTGTLCTSHLGRCTLMNIGRISARRAAADEPHNDWITSNTKSMESE